MDLVARALGAAELELVRRTEPAVLADLTEDELIELHTRVRRGRDKHAGQYRRQSAARVAEAGGRGAARPGNRRAAERAEVFEAALARVSTALARAARRSAADLKAERLAAARAAKTVPAAPPARRPRTLPRRRCGRRSRPPAGASGTRPRRPPARGGRRSATGAERGYGSAGCGTGAEASTSSPSRRARKLRRPPAPDAVAGRVEPGGPGAEAALAGRHGGDAAADPALARDPHVDQPVARPLVQSRDGHDGQRDAGDVGRDDALSGQRVDARLRWLVAYADSRTSPSRASGAAGETGQPVEPGTATAHRSSPPGARLAVAIAPAPAFTIGFVRPGRSRSVATIESNGRP